MINLFTQSYDVVDHMINGELEKIAQIAENLTETAKLASIDVDRKNDINKYALVLVNKNGEYFPKYAMHTSADTEVSIAFFIKKIATMPEELIKTAAQNLYSSAVYFNIDIPETLKALVKTAEFIDNKVYEFEVDFQEYEQKLIRLSKQAEIKKFALYNKYPIETEEQLQKTAEWFDRNKDKLSIDDQLEFVNNVINRMEELNTNIKSPAINKYANLDFNTFNKDFQHHLNMRISYLDNNGVEQAENLFSELWERKNSIEPIKVAYMLEIIDKDTNLDQLYGSHILNPIESVIGLKKEAKFVKIGNKKITIDDIKQIPFEKLSQVVDEDIAKDLYNDENLTLFESLPRPIKESIIKQLD